MVNVGEPKSPPFPPSTEKTTASADSSTGKHDGPPQMDLGRPDSDDGDDDERSASPEKKKKGGKGKPKEAEVKKQPEKEPEKQAEKEEEASGAVSGKEVRGKAAQEVEESRSEVELKAQLLNVVELFNRMPSYALEAEIHRLTGLIVQAHLGLHHGAGEYALYGTVYGTAYGSCPPPHRPGSS